MDKVSFFDAIDANKRNSMLLMALMVAIFMGVVIAISYIYDVGICGPVMGFFAILLYTGIVFFTGDKVILALSGAKEVKREEYPFLFNVVEGLALASQIPVPKIYIIEDRSPNAFATGRDPEHSSVAVTRGLLEMLNRQELEGVLAHEISHIANYDIRFSMIAVVLVGAIALLGDIVVRSLWFGGGNRRDSKGGGGVLAIIAIVFLILAPILATVVRFAISRQREYLADANGARLTRYPEGLASALEKISGAGIPTKNASDTTAPLYFSNPFPGKVGLSSAFATHPPAPERIKRLRSM